MAVMTGYRPGTFSWVDLSTTDSDGAKKFYIELFDWTAEDTPAGEDQIYTMLSKDGKKVGALYQQNDQQKSENIPPHWLSYATVKSADKTAEKAKALGGTLITSPFDVFDSGRMAVIQDPPGAVFAVWEPKAAIGAELVNEHGSLCWNELATTDTEASEKFYTSLFDWGSTTSDMGDFQYTSFMVGENPIGGMMKTGPQMEDAPPHWLVYFAVDDCDGIAEKVESLGGVVLAPPADIPDVGRFSVLRDPQGAVFAVLKLAIVAE